MIAVVTNLTASLIISLSSTFSDGVQLLEKKEYADAAKTFTKLVEAEAGRHLYLAPSLFMRAKCNLELKEKGRARTDIEKLFAADGSGQYWRAAAKLYSAADGKPKDLLPKKGPGAVWDQFMAALRAGDGDKAVKFVDDGFAEVIQGAVKSEEFDDVVEWLDENAFRESASGDVFASTSKMFCVGAGEPGLTVYFARIGNQWKVSGMYPRLQDMGGHRHGAVADGDDSGATRNQESVEDLVMALSDYAWEFEAMPEKLEDLLKGEHLERKSALMWVHPVSGKQQPFIFMMQAVPKPAELADKYLRFEGLLEDIAIIEDDADPFGGSAGQVGADQGLSILIAAPAAFKGTRDVGTPDGWQAMDEKTFARMALTEGWKIPGIKESLQTTEDVAEEVAKSVEKMRSGSSAARREARNAILALGLDALPEIKKYEKDRDPEIRESVKDIIERMK